MMVIRGDAATVAGVEAGEYIARIRNSAKKIYAREYLLYVLRGRKGSCPSLGNLSRTASQGVRRQLDELFRKIPL